MGTGALNAVVRQPDEAVLAALAALLTVLTFAAGFWSVRLHEAFREALGRDRQLTERIVESGRVFPQAEIERQYQEIKSELLDRHPRLFLAAAAILTLVGLVLALLTVWRNGLRASLSRSAEPFWGIATLSVGLVVVFALSEIDYVYLRRRLEAVLDGSLWGQVRLLDQKLFQAWNLHMRVRKTTWESETWKLLSYRLKLTVEESSRRSSSGSVPASPDRDASRGSTGRAISPSASESSSRLEEDVKRSLEVAERRRIEAEAKAGTDMPLILGAADTILAGLAERVGATGWGYLAGMRALRPLVEFYDPLLQEWFLPKQTAEQVRADVEFATASEAWNFRWWSLRACEAEIRKAAEEAARYEIIAQEASEKSGRAMKISSLPDHEWSSGDVLVLSPMQFDTYAQAVAILRNERRLGHSVGLSMTFELVFWGCFEGTNPFMREGRWEHISETMCEAVRDYAAIRIEDDNQLGWTDAETLLTLCTNTIEEAAEWPLPEDKRTPLLNELRRIRERVVAPSRESWQASRLRRSSGQNPATHLTSDD